MGIEWIDPPKPSQSQKAATASAPRSGATGGIEWLDEPPAPQDPRLAPATTNIQYGEGAAPDDVPTVGQSDFAAVSPPDPRYPQGSRFNPAYDTTTRTAAGNRQVPFFVNRLGELVDQTDGESGLDTMGTLAARFALSPVLGAPVADAMFPSGRLEAMQSGATSGLLGGLKNEAIAAGAGLGGAMRGTGYKGAYDETLTGMDERDRFLRTAYPNSYYGAGGAGMLAGGALTPEIKAGGAGVQALARMLPGQAAVNAPRIAKAGQLAMDTGVAAGSSWGSADPGERGAAAVVGGGMAIPLSVLTRGMLKGAPRNSLPGSSMPEALAGLPTKAQREASRRLGRVVRLTPEELAAKGANANPNMMAAEVAGQRAVDELSVLGRRDGASADAIKARVDERRMGRSQRLLDSFETNTGVSPDAAEGRYDGMLEAGRARAKPLYDEAFANTAPMTSPTIDRLLARPAVQRSMGTAKQIMGNEDVNPYTMGITFMDDPAEWASDVGGGLFDARQAPPAGPARAPSQGDSLATFLAKRGGVSDPGGELSALDANIWHRQQPFRPKLVREGGADIGAAAQAAVDAGYFPELGRDGVLSGDQLLAAVQDELAGKPRYARELTGSQADALAAREAESRFGPPQDEPPSPGDAYTGRPEPIGGPVYEQQPTTQALDYVIRSLDTQLEGRKVNGQLPNDPLTRSIVDTRKQLRNESFRLANENNRNPAYVKAVNEAGDYLGMKESFENGWKKVLGTKESERQFASEWKGLTPGEQEFRKAGAAHALYTLSRKGQLKPGALDTPMVGSKMRLMFGDEGFNRLKKDFDAEVAMQATERRIDPNAGSPSAGYLEIMREQDANLLRDMAIEAGVGVAVGGPHGALLGLRPAFRRAADKARQLGMSVETRDALGQILQGSPQDMAAFMANAPRGNPRLGQAMHLVSRGAPRLIGQLAANSR